MRRDPFHIFHQRHRVLENIVVDALQNVADRPAITFGHDRIGVVDVTIAIRRCRTVLPGNLELPGHRRQIVFEI